uniref:Uncharacterized protein n=1 Tax=Odontella aurita TaxID=265563 RepID=A0A7S4HZ20_9STRA
MSYTARYRVELSVPSPHARACRELSAIGDDGESGGPSLSVDHPLVEIACELQSLEDEDESSLDSANESVEEAGDPEGIYKSELGDDDLTMRKKLLVQLLDDPEVIFPSVNITALYPPDFNRMYLSHSCVPTHEVVLRGEDLQGIRVQRLVDGSCESIDDHPDGDAESSAILEERPPTVSLIDTEDDLDSRTALLQERGIDHCDCPRCEFERYCRRREEEDEEERSGSSATAIIVSPRHDDGALRRLLNLAKSERRNEDALDVCDEILRRNPADGPALLDRARIIGWEGDFVKRETLLEEAAVTRHNVEGERVVVHEPILRALEEARAYYRDGWEGDDRTESGTKSRASCRDWGWNPLPGLRDGSAFVAEGILDRSECEAAVTLVEEHLDGNWSSDRHYAVPTTDCQIYAVPSLLAWFNSRLESRIFPSLRSAFGIDEDDDAATTTTTTPRRLRVFDGFVVKYDYSEGQRRLPLHND